MFLELKKVDRIFSQLEEQATSGDIELQCVTVMPDHLHVVFRLGKRLSLGRVMAKFKSQTKETVEWQRDFYEHRIRPDECEEDYGFYVFMNPYVKKLCRLNSAWKGWRRWRSTPYEFETLLRDEGSVPEEWITKAEALSKSLPI